MEAQEARPQFYPGDLPLLPSMDCTVTWDDETGLLVKWSECLTEGGKARFKERVEAFTRKAHADADEASAEARKEALGLLMSQDLEDEVDPTIEEVLAFHESAGWTLLPEAAKGGPVRRVTLQLGTKRRTLNAIAAGVSIIVLGESSPNAGTAKQEQSRPPFEGLRLEL